MSLFDRCRGALFFALLTVGVAAAFVALLPCVILLPVARWPSFGALLRANRAFVNQCYYQYCVFLIYRFCGTRVVLHLEDPAIPNDRQIFAISNHRCTVDWMFTGWCYAAAMKHYPCLVFMLKDSLRAVPFFGYSAQIALNLFLSRKKQADLPHIERLLRYWRSISNQFAIVMYPEGTDLSEDNLIRSHEYALGKNLKTLDYVLYPRPAGFSNCVRLLQDGHGEREAPCSIVLHDLTVAYIDKVPHRRTTYKSILRGEFPTEVHIYAKRRTVGSLPSKQAEIESWLTRSFIDKEELLSLFYSGQVDTCAQRYPHCIEADITSFDSYAHVGSMVLLIAIQAYSVLHYSLFNRFLVLYTCSFAVVSMLGGFEQLELSAAGY